MTEFLEQIQVYDFTNLGKSIKFDYYLEPKETYIEDSDSTIINKNPWAEVEIQFKDEDKKYSFMILHNPEEEKYKIYLAELTSECFMGMGNIDVYHNLPFTIEVVFYSKIDIGIKFIGKENIQDIIEYNFGYIPHLLDYINEKIQEYIK